VAKMKTKGVRMNDFEIDRINKVAKKLNEEIGTEMYDFSQVVRVAVTQYLNRSDIKLLWED
jgi:hypothetical protein